MKLYLVNSSGIVSIPFETEYMLQTFWEVKSIKSSNRIIKEIQTHIDRRGQDNFILDSGAFSLFNGVKVSYAVLKRYIDLYCDFVIKYNIKQFLELDIDYLIGYDEVKKINEYITNKVGRKPLYVYHASTRTKEDLIYNMKNNDYIFWGGITDTGPGDKAQGLINTAYEYGCKVHLLGYTPNYLDKYKKLYSCDSSSWTMGGRNGIIFNFKTDTIEHIALKDKRRISFYGLNNHNLNQWNKYQMYLKNKGHITE